MKLAIRMALWILQAWWEESDIAVQFATDGSYRIFAVVKSVGVYSTPMANTVRIIQGQKRAREESDEKVGGAASGSDHVLKRRSWHLNILRLQIMIANHSLMSQLRLRHNLFQNLKRNLSSSESVIMQRKHSPRRPWRGIYNKDDGYSRLIQEVPECFPDLDRRRCMRGRLITGFTRVKLINIAWKIGAKSPIGLSPDFYRANWPGRPKVAYARFVSSWRGINKEKLCSQIWKRLIDTGNVTHR